MRLDDGLLTEAKKFAARTHRTLTALIEDALRQTLARARPVRRAARIKLTTAGGRGPLPGVNLDNSAALRELMDEGDAAR